MPRPKKPGAGEPKKRSRNGCWPCKARKVKCGEEKPGCLNCERQGESCDYSIRLNWGGRTKRLLDTAASETSSATSSPHMSIFSFHDTPITPFSAVTPSTPALSESFVNHPPARSATSALTLKPTPEPSMIDPELVRISQAQSHSVLAVEGMDEQTNQEQSWDSLPAALVHSQLQNAQLRGGLDYPSPSGSGFDVLNSNNVGYSSMNTVSPLSPPAMALLPPIFGPLYKSPKATGESAEPNNKRHKRIHPDDLPTVSGPVSALNAFSPDLCPATPLSPFLPLTPNSASVEEAIPLAAPKSGMAYSPQDPRRLSVQSLLVEPAGGKQDGYGSASRQTRPYSWEDASTTMYGYDMGYPDLDTPKNDDVHAIVVLSPPNGAMGLDHGSTYGKAEVRGKDIAFEKGGYYAKPVAIKISKSLMPLPPLLLENNMNLLYFHHFLNHTARILVPHDCEQNPFRQILPEMAVGDENILSLLLAFSASHRARLLSHPEPANRIALWVRDLFPKLRCALTSASASSQVTNATLASAIMMASLEIISPNTFEVSISWKDHLKMARQMIVARGGPRSMDRGDRIAYFFSRWFAYLDVLGSLSGNKNDEPLGSFYWSMENASKDEDYQIDCLMGFTTRCVGILARIAELAKRVEPLRFDDEGNIRPDWRPDVHTAHQADLIKRDLEEGLRDDIVYKGCNHHTSDPHSSEFETTWDSTEIYATNEMFHWAGLIHVYRRILAYPRHHVAVQHCVAQILGLLYKVRRGSTAEACLLFPMFAAGCASLEMGQREKILERVASVEGFGMTQVKRAKRVMVRVWETGKEWESLVDGEFFG